MGHLYPFCAKETSAGFGGMEGQVDLRRQKLTGILNNNRTKFCVV